MHNVWDEKMYELERSEALEAVTQAAFLCDAVRREMVEVQTLEKGDRSPVTVADFGAQALICRHLSAAFPQDPIVGEEHAGELRKPENGRLLQQVTAYVRRLVPDATAEQVCGWIDRGNANVTDRFWTVDPIDGTKGFLRDDQYAIALALVEAGQVRVAVLGCPALPRSLDRAQGDVGVLFVAVAGQGAAMAPLDAPNFEPIRVATEDAPDRWRFVESVERAHGNPALQERVAQAVGIVRPPLKLDSQAKYGAVARGDAALYLRLPSPASPDYREKIWDHAAGALLVTEAGGRVTDMEGQPLDFTSGVRMKRNRGVVVSNGVLHRPALEALGER